MKELIQTLDNCKAILKDYYENDLAEAVNEYEVKNQIDNIHRIMLMILPVENKFARKCSCCGKGMNNGYVINDGDEYFCEDACFKQEYKEYDIEDLELGDSENYWTEWDIDTDIEYILVNKELIHVGNL
jgi:hypothetical protein